jgi:hypothetical protein
MAIYEFKDPAAFKDALRKRLKVTEGKENSAVEKGLYVAAEFLNEKAKEMFGHYQDGWDELTQATRKDRVKKGFTENDPLYRTGDLKEHSKFSVEGRRAVVGNTSQIMVYQEKGTMSTGWHGAKGIPPRPVYLIVYHKHKEEAIELFADEFMKKLR